MEKNLKILIVRLSAIGDVVHSLPILHALKSRFPHCTIGWVVEDKAADLIIDNPLIDNVYVIPKQKWKKNKSYLKNTLEFFQIIKKIQNEKYDIAIDLQELLKSAVITYLSKAPRRIAHKKTREFAEFFVNEKLPAHNIFDPDKMIIERYLEAASYLGADTKDIKFSLPVINDTIKENVTNLLKNIDSTKKTIAFIPGTIWQTKHWIEPYWQQLFLNTYKEYNVIFIGSNKESELIYKITTGIANDKYTSLAGRTSLLELIEVFKRCNMVISTDTGPMHIANATQIPDIISIFGATSYKRSCPYGKNNIALSANIKCQPCFKRKCYNKKQDMECMKLITPELILKKINEKFIL